MITIHISLRPFGRQRLDIATKGDVSDCGEIEGTFFALLLFLSFINYPSLRIVLLIYFFFSFQFQALFTMDPSEHGRRLFGMGPTVNGTENVGKPHTLEDYAIDHFRPPPKRTASKSLTLASARRGNIRNLLLRNKRFMLDEIV